MGEVNLRFGLGVDQVSAETGLLSDRKSGQSAARRIVNYDITNTSQMLRRKGSVQVVGIEDAHSLWSAEGSPVAYFAAGSTLYSFDGETHTSLVTGLAPGFPISFLDVAGDVYWSNGVNSGVLLMGETNVPWGATEVTGSLGQTYLSQIRGTIIRHYKGRIYAIDGRVVWATDPLDYMRVDTARGFMLFESEIVLFEPVSDGIYLGTQNEGVRFLAGSDFKQFNLVSADDLQAVRGSGLHVDGAVFGAEDNSAIWLTKRGWVLGMTGGATKRLTDDRTALPAYESAVSILRESDGIRQILSFARGGSESAGASDVMTTEVIRNGVLLV